MTETVSLGVHGACGHRGRGHHWLISASTRRLNQISVRLQDVEEIKYEVDPIRAWHLRCQTGEVLAEIDNCDERALSALSRGVVIVTAARSCLSRPTGMYRDFPFIQ